jgi:acyl-CoA thioesterase
VTGVESEFDRATAIRPASETSGAYDVTIDPGWFVAGPNGGYVAALLMRALVSEVGDPARPARSLTVHFAQPAAEGPARVETALHRAGRSMSFLSARLVQDDHHVASALVAFGTGRAELAFQDDQPEVADWSDVAAVGTTGVPIADRYEYRPLAPAELFSGAPSDYWCWLRLREPRPVDAVLLATHVDALYPALMLRSTTPVLVPTVDLTVHFRQSPRPGFDGWCLAHVRSRTAAEGFVEEDVDLFDDEGRLLAQSRQLALVLPVV